MEPWFDQRYYGLTNQSGGTTTPPGYNSWIPWIDLALQAGTSYANYSQQQDTNTKNARLQREQRDWEKMMSDTAVQRRADDIEKAGGNRALAFVNGSEATTPNVTPAQLQAPRYDAPRLNTAALMMKAQIDNLKSQTSKNSAEARATTLATDITEAGADYDVKYHVLGSAQQYANQRALADEIRARTAVLTSDNIAKQIANYIGTHTTEDAISAIQSDAILKELHIKPAELKSNWEEIKDDALKALLRHRKFTGGR